MDVKIEPMTKEDLPQILEIENLSFSLPWSRELFEQELSLENSFFFVAKTENDKIAAYAGFWLVIDEVHIINLAVNLGSRRQGIGEKLIRYLLELAKEKGAKRATLEVRFSNIPARKLYEKLRFKSIAIRKNYYADNREDALIMWKDNLLLTK